MAKKSAEKAVKPSKSINKPAAAVNVATETKMSISSKYYPRDLQEQLEQIITGLREHQIDLGGGRNTEGVEAQRTELTDLDKQVLELETKLASVKDTRDQKRVEYWQFASGLRKAVAGIYGPDSLEYQSLGGTRSSERNRPQRKPKDTPENA